MKFKIPTRKQKFLSRMKWHRWFAWRPIRVHQQIVWLETIERCLVKHQLTENDDDDHYENHTCWGLGYSYDFGYYENGFYYKYDYRVLENKKTKKSQSIS